MRYLLILPVIVGLVVAACGGAAQPTPTPAPAPTRLAPPTLTPSPAEAPRAVAQPTAAPTATPRPTTPPPALGGTRLKGELIAALSTVSAIAHREPLWEELTGTINYPYMLSNGLLERNDEGVIVGAVASGWNTSPDGLEWVFTLRPEPRFSSGEPVTAEDVVFTLRQFKERPLSDVLKGAQILARGQDVVIRTRDPFLPLHNYLGMGIVPKTYFEAVGQEGFSRRPIGNGPFILKTRRIGDFFEWLGRDDYWREGPFVRSVQWRIVPEESTRIAMLRTGEADVANNVSPAPAKQLKGVPGIKIVDALDTTFIFGSFVSASKVVPGGWAPNESSPLANLKVRQALNYAIDRQLIIDGVYDRRGTPSVTMVPRWVAGTDSTLKPYAYDPAKAKRLLAEAGYPNGFQLELATAEQRVLPLVPDVTLVVQQMLANVGVKAQVKKYEYLALIDARRTRGVDGIAMASSAPTGMFNAWQSAWVRDSCGQYSGVCDLAFTGRLEEIGRISNPKELEEQSRWVDRYTYENAFNLYILHGSATHGIRSRVTHFPLQRGSPAIENYARVKVAD